MKQEGDLYKHKNTFMPQTCSELSRTIAQIYTD